MSEQGWQPVKGWPQYEVSRDGHLRKVGSGLAVGQWLNDQGYPMARLSSPRRMVRVHRLVAEAFIPNPENHRTVNHLNNVRSDNRVANLEWCSQRDNLAHAARQGRMPRDYWKGKRSPRALLSDDTVRAIRAAYDNDEGSWETLARRFHISKRAVGRLICRETYGDV